jgi:hypothetical protein
VEVEKFICVMENKIQYNILRVRELNKIRRDNGIYITLDELELRYRNNFPHTYIMMARGWIGGKKGTHMCYGK